MSPKLAKVQVEKIFTTLCATYPNYQEQFQKGFDDLVQDLEQLDADLSQELAPFAGDALLVSHPAFAYYCADYHLKQLSIECEGKDPLPQDIEKTVKEAKSAHVQSILTQPQYNNKAAILIGEQLHLPVYEVDPYAQDYIQNLRHITKLIINSSSK
jgi:zinc transport system substrate-binding protein